jgi:hypothetical protein
MISPYEPVAVVPQSALARGQKFRKLWLSGWIFGAATLVLGAFVGGQALAYHRSMNDLTEARQEIERVKADQVKVTTAFVKAWEDQRNGINLVQSWAEFVKNRDEMIAYNKQNKPSEKLASKGR